MSNEIKLPNSEQLETFMEVVKERDVTVTEGSDIYLDATDRFGGISILYLPNYINSFCGWVGTDDDHDFRLRHRVHTEDRTTNFPAFAGTFELINVENDDVGNFNHKKDEAQRLSKAVRFQLMNDSGSDRDYDVSLFGVRGA